MQTRAGGLKYVEHERRCAAAGAPARGQPHPELRGKEIRFVNALVDRQTSFRGLLWW